MNIKNIKMKEEELKDLIGKYYDGITTSAEEKVLREYFSMNSPEGFEAEKEIFSYYRSIPVVPEPSDDLEARILGRINAMESTRGSDRHRRYLVPLLSVAASLFILTGLWLFYQNRSESIDTYNDPAIAYAETMKILYSVSVQLNRGARDMEPLSKLSDITEKSIKTLSKSSQKIERNLTFLTKSVKDADMQLNKNNK
jgi:hypothetical protein